MVRILWKSWLCDCNFYWIKMWSKIISRWGFLYFSFLIFIHIIMFLFSCLYLLLIWLFTSHLNLTSYFNFYMQEFTSFFFFFKVLLVKSRTITLILIILYFFTWTPSGVEYRDNLNTRLTFHFWLLWLFCSFSVFESDNFSYFFQPWQASLHVRKENVTFFPKIEC